MCFPSFLRHKLRFKLYAAQCSQRPDPFCLQATLACIRLMTSLGGMLCRFATPACRKWQKVLFRSIDHWILCWPCGWARCWMLQEMDHMEASCVFYVKVCRFDQFEKSKIRVLTVTSLGMVMPIVDYDLIVSVWFMWDPGSVLTQTSPDILSVEERPFYIYQTWDISCRSSQCTPVTQQTTLDRLSGMARFLESPAALRSRIQLDSNVQVGCHSFHFDL